MLGRVSPSSQIVTTSIQTRAESTSSVGTERLLNQAELRRLLYSNESTSACQPRSETPRSKYWPCQTKRFWDSWYVDDDGPVRRYRVWDGQTSWLRWTRWGVSCFDQTRICRHESYRGTCHRWVFFFGSFWKEFTIFLDGKIIRKSTQCSPPPFLNRKKNEKPKS